MITTALVFAFLITADGILAHKGPMGNLMSQFSCVGAEIHSVLRKFEQCGTTLIDPTLTVRLSRPLQIHEDRTHVYEELASYMCSQKTQFKSCYNGLLNDLAPCLNKSRGFNINSNNQGMAQLIDHVCSNITEFIAEKGVECVTGIRIEDCVKGDIIGWIDFPLALINLNKEQCSKFDQISECVMRQLTSCSQVARKVTDIYVQDLRTLFSCAGADVTPPTVTASVV